LGPCNLKVREIIEHIAACIAIVIATVLIAMAICSNAQDKSDQYLKALKNCSAVRQQYMISNLK
jgi:ribosome maturation protein Sdo1